MENETKQDELTILDEIEAFINRYVHLPTEHNARVMALMAAASYATPVFPATFRALFAGPPNSGKTTAMNVTAKMCANATDLSGTPDGARSEIMGLANTPELGPPTFYLDDLTLFGESGMNQTRDLRAEVLKRGYKRGEKMRVSRSGVSKKFSIYAPFLLSGLEVAVPADIRTRSIVLWHEKGRAQLYFDARYAEPEALRFGRALKGIVGQHLEAMKDFRGYGYHPKLTDRYLEIWESLLACARFVGGQKWVNYCIDAFVSLTNNGSSVVLTPRQELIRDVIAIMDGPLSWAAEAGFIPGTLLASELNRMDGGYSEMDDNALLQHIAANMEGITKRQVAGLLKRGFPKDRMTGYLASGIRAEWDKIRPADPDDVEDPERISPFDILDEENGQFENIDDLVQEVPGVLGVSQQDLSKDEPVMSLVAPPCEDDTEQTPTRRRSAKLPNVERKFLKENALA